jgi:hypothetical protein
VQSDVAGARAQRDQGLAMVSQRRIEGSGAHGQLTATLSELARSVQSL